MTDYLVTGAAGFVGSNLSRALLERGYRVRGFDNFETGDPANVESLTDHPDFEFHRGDLRSTAAVEAAVEDATHVLHQAAVPSVPRSIDDPVGVTEANCLGTTKLLTAARDAGAETVVVASSSSVYGPTETQPKREDQPPNPVSPYALSKYWTEQLACQYSEFYGLDTVALRYFNVFGPNQDPNGQYAAVIPKFITAMLDGERPPVYGDGEQSRDFTHVENVVEANVRAAESDVAGEVVNVGCNDRVTLNELISLINAHLGTDLEPRYLEPRAGDVRHSQASIERAQRLLGYEPVVEFREGLERTIEHYREP